MRITKIFLFAFLVTRNLLALPVDQIHDFDLRYQLKNTNEKLVDNSGDNFESLYGVRNFRAVLRGLVYRGGANNSYNKFEKRPNMNPLPNMGLENLCKEGFNQSIYLYPTNFKIAPRQVRCTDRNGKDRRLAYDQITAFDEKNTERFIKIVYDLIQSENSGPLYLHCWNGWHASGLISALLLRQFCGLSGQQALKYWIENTDNHSDGYQDAKDRIKNFKPFEKYLIPKEIQNQICL